VEQVTTLGLRIDGAEEIERQLRKISAKAQRGVLRKALRKAAQPVLREAKKKAPKRTGQYRKSLAIAASVTARDASARVGSRKGRPGSPSSRSHLLERGTIKMRARPHLEPALKEQRGEAVEIFARQMRNEIEKALR